MSLRTMPQSMGVNLTYARPARVWWRRRWVVRFALLLAVVGGLAGAWSRWGGILRLQADVYHAQRRGLRWTSPPGHVVLETAPVPAARLRAEGYSGAGGPTGGRKADDIAFPMDAWRVLNDYFQARGRLERHHGLPGYHLQDSWWGLFRERGSLAFLHSRKTPDGREYLVAVAVFWHEKSRSAYLETTVKPVSVWTTPADLQFGWVAPTAPGGTIKAAAGPKNVGIWFSPSPLRLYAGQPDPVDDSRFTIDYEVDGARETIEGRLHDGGHVGLRFLSGPWATEE